MKYPSLTTLQNAVLVVLTTASLYQMTQISGLSSAINQMPTTDQLESLQAQFDRFETEIDRTRPLDFVSSDEFQLNERNTAARLDALDQAVAPTEGMDQLQQELKRLSAEVISAQAQLVSLQATIENLPPAVRKPSERPHTKPTAKTQTPKSIVLPFNILSIESRGGETFLAVAAFDAPHLSDVVLMRPTSAYMGWRLSSLLPDQARFVRPDGSSLTAAIGQE